MKTKHFWLSAFLSFNFYFLVGVLSKGIEKKEHKKSKVPVKTTKDVAGKKRDSTATPELVAVATQDNDDADADEDEPSKKKINLSSDLYHLRFIS